MTVMKSLYIYAGLVSLVGLTVSAAADNNTIIKGFSVGKVIPGYNCLLLNLPPEAETDKTFNKFPSSFAAPTEGSRQLGKEMGIVYAVWPINEVNGFIQILRSNGDRGWLAAKEVRPFKYPLYSDIPGKCTISMSPSGMIGFKGYSLSQAK